LGQQGKIQHTIKRVRLEDVNENIDLLRDGEIQGRAVIVFDIDGENTDRMRDKNAAKTQTAIAATSA
jgi:hypothetical protein